MGSDGSTFIDRVERIEISNNNSNYILAHKGKLPQLHDVKPRLYLKWSLGEYSDCPPYCLHTPTSLRFIVR